MKKLLCILFILTLLLAGCKKQQTATGIPIPESTIPTGAPTMELGQMLTPQQAQDAALEQAGFTQEDVIGLHATIEIEGGIPYYEVTFRSGHVEYAYRIHAETGKVLSAEKD